MSGRIIGGYLVDANFAYAGLACFGVVAIAFITLSVKYWKKYTLVLTIGTACMALGFGIRIAVNKNPTQLGPYIGMILFILLSPCAFLASNYILLPLLATHLSLDLLLPLGARPNAALPGGWTKPRMAKYFIISDLVTFFIQATGGGMQASGIKTVGSQLPTIGNYIALTGLVLQLGSFTIFLYLLLRFGIQVSRSSPTAWFTPLDSSSSSSMVETAPVAMADLSKDPKDQAGEGYTEPQADYVLSSGEGEGGRGRNMKPFWWALVISSFGFLIRSIFRVAEYASGRLGYLQTHEWAFYALDSVPLLFGVGVFVWWWPGRWLVGGGGGGRGVVAGV